MTFTNNKKKVLICDDEENIREALKLILENHFELILTLSGAQCLKCLKNAEDIGVVLLDIHMPRMDGFKILKTIREHYPLLPVLMVTGYQSVEAVSQCAQLGANSYIVKPFNSQEVVAMVKKWMK